MNKQELIDSLLTDHKEDVLSAISTVITEKNKSYVGGKLKINQLILEETLKSTIKYGRNDLNRFYELFLSLLLPKVKPRKYEKKREV